MDPDFWKTHIALFLERNFKVSEKRIPLRFYRLKNDAHRKRGKIISSLYFLEHFKKT